MPDMRPRVGQKLIFGDEPDTFEVVVVAFDPDEEIWVCMDRDGDVLLMWFDENGQNGIVEPQINWAEYEE